LEGKGKMFEINKERKKKNIWKNNNVSSNSFLHVHYPKTNHHHHHKQRQRNNNIIHNHMSAKNRIWNDRVNDCCVVIANLTQMKE